MKTLVVIMDGITSQDYEAMNCYAAKEVEVLNLSDALDKTIPVPFPLMDRVKLLSKHQARVVESLTAWIGEMGEKKISRGRNIKQILAAPGGISMWWFNSLQYKFHREYLLSTQLMFLGIIKELLDSNIYEKCVIFGGQPDYLSALKELIADPRLQVTVRTGRYQTKEFTLFIRGSIGAFLYALYMLWSILKCKLFYKPRTLPGDRPDITFVSIYPLSQAVSNGRIQERYYGQLPEELRKRGLSVNFLSISDASKNIRNLFSLDYFKAAQTYDHNITLIESMLAIKDIIIKYFDYLKIAGRIYLLPRNEKRELCTVDGKDYSPLLLEYILTSAYDTSNIRALLLAEAAFKYAKQYRPGMIFTCYDINHCGRAVISGIRKYDNRLPIIGMQHASFPSTKLETHYHNSDIDKNLGGTDLINYVPFVDYELFQGKNTMELFITAGLPRSRCLLLGSPRFDPLFKLINRPKVNVSRMLNTSINIPKDKKVLLVATGLYDYDVKQLLEVLYEAIDARYFIIFKPHPNRTIEQIIKPYERMHPEISYQISTNNIHELLLLSDVLLTTHSTVAEEAIVMGKPAISVHAGIRINIGALASMGLDVCAHDPRELKIKLDRYLNPGDDSFAKMREYVIEQCFGIFDGRATERVADYLMNNIKGTSGAHYVKPD